MFRSLFRPLIGNWVNDFDYICVYTAGRQRCNLDFSPSRHLPAACWQTLFACPIRVHVRAMIYYLLESPRKSRTEEELLGFPSERNLLPVNYIILCRSSSSCREKCLPALLSFLFFKNTKYYHVLYTSVKALCNRLTFQRIPDPGHTSCARTYRYTG